MKRLTLILVVFCVPPGLAAEVTDATGRKVTIPDRIEHVLPAGPPASVLLAAIAPGQMLGFAGPISEESKFGSGAGGEGTAHGTPTDWPTGHHGGDSGATPRPDYRLRHRLAALQATGAGDPKKDRYPDTVVRRCAGSDPSGRPHRRANPASAGAGRSRLPVSPRRSWRCRFRKKPTRASIMLAAPTVCRQPRQTPT